MVQNNLHQKAIELRLKGKSYNEIKRALGIPKSTLSSWFKNFTLPLPIKQILEEKRRAPRQQLMEFNRRRTKAIQKENKKIIQDAANEIKKISKYDLLLVGTALYWAEGYNNQSKVHSPYLSFGNSNPNIVALYVYFLRKCMQIPTEKMRPFVQVHHNVNVKSAIAFWAKICNIPKEKFHITHQISSAGKNKRPYNSLPYGTFKLDVSGRRNFYQIKGWIDGLTKQTT